MAAMTVVVMGARDGEKVEEGPFIDREKRASESYEIISQRSILRGKDEQQLCGRYGCVHKYRQVKHIVDLYLDLCLVL